MSDQTMGQRLRLLRVATGLSQRKMADLCGLCLKTWQNYETDATEMRPSHIAALELHGANAIDYLFGRSEMLFYDTAGAVRRSILATLSKRRGE